MSGCSRQIVYTALGLTGFSDAIVAMAARTVPCISGGAWSKRASAAACFLENDEGDSLYVTRTTDSTT